MYPLSTARVVAALFFSLILLAFGGCGNQSGPAQALDEFVEAANDRDCEKLFELIDYSDLEAAQPLFSKEQELEDCKRRREENQDGDSEITGYKILEEKIDGDSAELNVEIDTKDSRGERTETTLLIFRRIDGEWRAVIGTN